MEDEGSDFREVGMWDGWFAVTSDSRGSCVGKGVKRVHYIIEKLGET